MKKTSRIDNRLINQSEIARRLGKSQAYINLILHGKRGNKKILAEIKALIKEIRLD